MDDYEAKGLLVLSQVPGGNSEFGVDLHSWGLGPRFRGLDGIPHGLHLFTLSSGSSPQGGNRSGLFALFSPNNPVCHAQWDPESESLVPSIPLIGGNERLRERLFVEAGGPCLGPYPTTGELSQNWESLVNHISPSLLDRVFGAATGDFPCWTFSAMDATSKYSQVPDKRFPSTTDATQQSSKAYLHLTEFDLKRSFSPAASGPERTHYAQDKSWLLRKILQEIPPKELIGELQLAFILVLIGHVYDGLEHWKALLGLLTLSQEALSQPDLLHTLWVPALATIQSQLTLCPKDFFQDALAADNFVHTCLLGLARAANTLSSPLDSALEQALESLWDSVSSRFNWDIMAQVQTEEENADKKQLSRSVDTLDDEEEEEEEDDEYAPAIVYTEDAPASR